MTDDRGPRTGNRAPVQRLVMVGAVLEALVTLAAYFVGGVNAAIAALIGANIAIGAQIVAVAALRPAMKASQAQFQQRWVLGMAARFGSFVVLAVLMIVLKDRLPVAWMASGYLSLLLVLLFAETKFLT